MKDEKVETKKCKNCLKRVIAEKFNCPYCGRTDFFLDGLETMLGKLGRFSGLERIEAMFFQNKNEQKC